MTTAPPVTVEEPLDVPKPEGDDLQLWSVTTILGTLAKEGLIYWSAEEAAKAAVSIAKSLPQRIAEDGEAEVVKWLRDARFRRPKGQRTAAELGTAVHDACEGFALTGKRPECDADVAPFLDQFERWCEKWQPVYEAAEMTVYSPTYGYAGTLDAIATVGDRKCVIDYKSSLKSFDARGKVTSPYPESAALQVAAYRHAEMAAAWRPRRYEKFRRRYYLLGESEREQGIKVPEVDGGLVIHITPEHCLAFPVRCDESVFEAFLFVLESARWQLETSKTVMGDPLIHPSEA